MSENKPHQRIRGAAAELAAAVSEARNALPHAVEFDDIRVLHNACTAASTTVSKVTGPIASEFNKLNAIRLEVKRKEEERARKAELRKANAILTKIVDAGYRVLATKMHPDKGGTEEDMIRLNKARTELKKQLGWVSLP